MLKRLWMGESCLVLFLAHNITHVSLVISCPSLLKNTRVFFYFADGHLKCEALPGTEGVTDPETMTPRTLGANRAGVSSDRRTDGFLAF